MANLRIVSDNAADRAVITSTGSAGSLVPSNLQTDIKTEIWRSTIASSADLTLTWPSAEFVSMVSVCFINITSIGKMRVKGYTEPGDVTPLFDTGSQFAAPSTIDGSLDWGGTSLGSNAYSFGGNTYATLYFATKSVKKLVITFSDPTNPAGYIQAARVVTGVYWSPENNCEYGAEITFGDMSKQERSDAGDLKTDRGPRYKIISADVTMMPKADRNRMWRIFGANGMTYPIFFSLVPEDSDAMEEQIYQVYGKLSKLSSLRYQFINQFNTKLDIEEI